MPLFSIVMPTRNRGHLLAYALRSALDQRWEDYEIIVSDNSSSDETAAVVRRLANNRVKYVRTDRVYPMPDSWEFALGRAKGEYILYLCDDDAMCQTLLPSIAKIIQARRPEVVCWMHATYFSDNHPVTRWRNQLSLPYCTGGLLEIDSRAALSEMFALRGNPARLPRMLNSCCHRSVIQRIRAQAGRFFLPPNPDTSSCAEMLATIRSFTYVDQALAIGGACAESTGCSSAQDRGAATQTVIKEFGKARVFDRVPVSAITITNSIADSLVRVKDAMGDSLKEFEINWIHYFADCYFELTSLLVDPSVTRAEREEIRTVLKKWPARFRRQVWAAYLRRAIPWAAVRWSGAIGRPVPWVRHFGRAFQRAKAGTRIVRGEEGGFKDILECRRLVGAP